MQAKLNFSVVTSESKLSNLLQEWEDPIFKNVGKLKKKISFNSDILKIAQRI